MSFWMRNGVRHGGKQLKMPAQLHDSSSSFIETEFNTGGPNHTKKFVPLHLKSCRSAIEDHIRTVRQIHDTAVDHDSWWRLGELRWEPEGQADKCRKFRQLFHFFEFAHLERFFGLLHRASEHVLV